MAPECQSFLDNVVAQRHSIAELSRRTHSRETGSIATACLARSSSPLSPTTHSRSNGDFPVLAVKAYRRISRADHSHLAFLAACHAQLGDAAAAKGAAQEVLQRAPDFSIERFIATHHYKHESDREHIRAALAKAQLPA